MTHLSYRAKTLGNPRRTFPQLWSLRFISTASKGNSTPSTSKQERVQLFLTCFEAFGPPNALATRVASSHVFFAWYISTAFQYNLQPTSTTSVKNFSLVSKRLARRTSWRPVSRPPTGWSPGTSAPRSSSPPPRSSATPPRGSARSPPAAARAPRGSRGASRGGILPRAWKKRRNKGGKYRQRLIWKTSGVFLRPLSCRLKASGASKVTLRFFLCLEISVRQRRSVVLSGMQHRLLLQPTNPIWRPFDAYRCEEQPHVPSHLTMLWKIVILGTCWIDMLP